MDTGYLYAKTLEQLKLIARQEGIRLPARAGKNKIIELIAAALEKKSAAKAEPVKAQEQQAESAVDKPQADEKPAQRETSVQAAEKPVKRRGRPRKEQPEQVSGTENEAKENTAERKSTEESKAPARKKTARASSAGKKGNPKKKIADSEGQQVVLEGNTSEEMKAEEQPALTAAEAELPVQTAPVAEAAFEEQAENTAENGAAESTPETSEENVKNVPVQDWGEGAGVLELMAEGYGFLRAENCLPGPRDVYLSQTQIRRFNLRSGDYITGRTRPQRYGDRSEGMIYVSTVNGATADEARRRPHFEDLTPVFPDERLRLENPLGNTDYALRTIDLIAPIGKGQRGLIVSPPKAGKTVLLKKIANAITDNYPEVQLMVVLIDERPEEVTDMQRSTSGEVLYSTFDEEPENHTKLSEMVLDKAQRQVEMGKDVVILLDSITRLARAYNLVIPPTGRSLSGGLDPGALYKPKKFFGSARNIENGGSLTIIATALVDTGSRMDDIIYEEFKGTGNMELHLDRKLSERRVFPAIDINRSGTRRDELLYTPEEADGALMIRRNVASAGNQDDTEQLISLMAKTTSNAEFLRRLKSWIGAFK